MSASASKLPVLDIWRQRFAFQPAAAAQLPDWLGSTWRGAFGHQLKRLSCVTGLPDCVSCALFNSCSHAEIFESPPTSSVGKMRKYNAVPHPYVLLPDPGGDVASSDSIGLEVRLFGKATRHQRLVADAIRLGAEQGLGRERTQLLPLPLPDAEKITLDLNTIKPPPGALRISLLTPLRLRIKGKPVTPDMLTFGDFFSVLLRRISMLCSFYQQRELDIDFSHLVSQARNNEFSHRQLRTIKLKRWSGRQKHSIDMSGLVGELRLESEQLELFWPYLYLGQYTLTGRGTVMGLGHYRIEAAM